MDLPEPDRHAFIVRVWLEETAEKTARVIWRGHITHVPTGERRYIKNLKEVTDFIAHYLQASGIRLGLRSRIRRWLNRL
jgi:hypothetical protein